MQLPTPLRCISRTPRAPPRSAPASSATPSSSVVSATECTSGIGQRAVDQDAMPGIRHIGELRDVVAAQQIVELVLQLTEPAPRRPWRSCSSSRQRGRRHSSDTRQIGDIAIFRPAPAPRPPSLGVSRDKIARRVRRSGMATRRRQDYLEFQRMFGRRIPRERGARCLPKRSEAAPKRVKRRPPMSDLFRNRAGALALVLALTLALWALVFAIVGLIWGGF